MIKQINNKKFFTNIGKLVIGGNMSFNADKLVSVNIDDDGSLGISTTIDVRRTCTGLDGEDFPDQPWDSKKAFDDFNKAWLNALASP